MREIHDIVDIQRAAWGMDDLGIVPTFEMKAIASVGTLLGAFEGHRVIGFIYAFDQLPDSHYSHMMAIHPDWQGKSIGYKLKQAHYRIAQESGIKHIRWTVDPLLPNNAYLNFAKLGVVCNTYYKDYYGDPASEGVDLYAGLPTDRFLVDWRIESERVARRIIDHSQDRVEKSALLSVVKVANTIEDDLPKLSGEIWDLSDRFLVEVPSNFQNLRSNKLEKAKEWRMFFRNICINYFSKGFYVVDYHSFNRKMNFYEFDIIS